MSRNERICAISTHLDQPWQDGTELNVKRLRVFARLAEIRNVNAAADVLFLTQSAISRSLKALEADVGQPLFLRSSRGMALTDVGELLYRRAARAFDYLEAAEGEIQKNRHGVHKGRAMASLVTRVAPRHLSIIPAIGEYRSETVAARFLGITQPAVNAALRDLELSLGEQLFARTSRGMVPTVAGDVLIRSFKLYSSEIRSFSSDLAQREGDMSGSVVVGSLPLSGAGLIAPAATAFCSAFPGIRLTVLEGHYETLLNGLVCGDIDFIVGTLHATAHPQVLQQEMVTDCLVAVVRADHPLTKRRSLSVATLMSAQWIIPFRRTATHNMFEKAMLKAGLSTPDGAIEVNSVAIARALLLQSDRLSVLPMTQVRQDVLGGTVAVLPVDLSSAVLHLGVAMRRDAAHTPGQAAFLQVLHRIHGGGNHSA